MKEVFIMFLRMNLLVMKNQRIDPTCVFILNIDYPPIGIGIVNQLLLEELARCWRCSALVALYRFLHKPI